MCYTQPQFGALRPNASTILISEHFHIINIKRLKDCGTLSLNKVAYNDRTRVPWC